jgi:hypothetical protein
VTGLDLITSSLKLIGVLASGESLSASDAADGLTTLTQLLASWSTESLIIPARVREVFPLVSGKATYTMGAGGDFNTTRPQRIEQALIQIGSGTSVIEFPMRILNQDQYADICTKGMAGSIPHGLYEDQAFPLDNLNIYPVPADSANSLVLYSWKPLASLLTLTDAITLPPGYDRALRFNLAIDLAPEYGKTASENVIAVATEAKATLKRQNTRPRYLKCDNALLARGRGGGGGMSIFAGGGSGGDSGPFDEGTF